jgi:hypothetical protein
MTDDLSRAARIAQLNDAFRLTAGMPVNADVQGRCFMTSGVASLDAEAQAAILDGVRSFDTFDRGNDPYGEHDFGAVDAPGGERVFWKIDYFADAAMEYGSEEPADPTKSFRVLTVMLAAEY